MIVLIGDRVYSKKEAALAAIREVRDRILETGSVSQEDDEFLRDLVAMHPDAEDKVGAGIVRFEVRHNLGNTYGFWIIRTDGSETDFSFMKSLYGATHEADVRSAMRYAVIDQMEAARDLAFSTASSLLCPITGEAITRESCHVDHATPTFIEIADEFAEQHGGYEAITTVPSDGNIGRRFESNEVQEAWRAFHAGRAELRVVSKTANLSILRRGVARRRK